MRQPTARQLELLRFIASNIRSHGFVPSFREAMAHFGFASTNTVADHLNALERKGLLRTRALDKRRSYSLTSAGWELCPLATGTVEMPVICLECSRRFFRGTEADHRCAAEDLARAS